MTATIHHPFVRLILESQDGSKIEMDLTRCTIVSITRDSDGEMEIVVRGSAFTQKVLPEKS